MESRMDDNQKMNFRYNCIQATRGDQLTTKFRHIWNEREE